jgi:uncharacterized protein (TIGR01777 family)
VPIFERSVELPVSATQAFRWHERPGALERLIPPWERVRVTHASGGIQDGARVELVARLGPLPLKWIAEHSEYRSGESFHDVQLSGPFAQWEHTHRFEPLSPTTCRLIDHVEFRPPGGQLGALLSGPMVANKLAQMFAYRHQTTYDDLAAHAPYLEKNRMHVLVTGATGMVGSALIPFLTTGGHRVTKLVRKQAGEGEASWDPAAGTIDSAALAACDVVVHLAGDNIADGRWTKAKKQRIVDSRVQGTRLIAESLAKLPQPRKTLISASAIGFYGNRGDEWLDETSTAGEGFLADVCQQWEAAAQPARDAGLRVVNLRLGVILSPRGGALAKMLFPFKTGGGGVVGGGKQYWSWITLDDVVGAIHHAITQESLSGPVNLVAPNPVTNYEFTKTLGRVLSRPTILPMPAFAARLLLGEMADELLLASQRVRPSRLEGTAYPFRHPQLEEALRAVLGKRKLAA